jgi:hypothetical protein
MSERQADINNEVLYFIATGTNTKRDEVEKTFDNYLSEEVSTALTCLAMTGCIDCDGEKIWATPTGMTRAEEHKKSLPRTVRKF